MPSSTHPAVPSPTDRASPPLVLASASPRRRELLARFGIPFEIVPSGVDERSLQAPTPREFAILAAREKSLDVARRVEAGTVVVGADTIVCVPNRPSCRCPAPSADNRDAPSETVLGKPSGPEEARSMLQRLSGLTHRVITGVAVRTARGEVRADGEETLVTFRTLSEAEIDAYVASGEPLDKAGAYGAQGLGIALIESVQGDFTNVIGLPMDLVRRLLSEDYPQAADRP